MKRNFKKTGFKEFQLSGTGTSIIAITVNVLYDKTLNYNKL